MREWFLKHAYTTFLVLMLTMIIPASIGYYILCSIILISYIVLWFLVMHKEKVMQCCSGRQYAIEEKIQDLKNNYTEEHVEAVIEKIQEIYTNNGWNKDMFLCLERFYKLEHSFTEFFRLIAFAVITGMISSTVFYLTIEEIQGGSSLVSTIILIGASLQILLAVVCVYYYISIYRPSTKKGINFYIGKCEKQYLEKIINKAKE
ncbi:hypothetical protein CACET_c15860 [Clostridium aceticum]|uniref:Uncharacterized protein n=1 Tax=Clostridium aceticum TaxID=84022 RepID=A0A0D8ICC7_9CLOT|nr:hypothetical protein [Clostridium aceticum]AKL95035.1 hypothetical protein CACET_c15860 [Clostridium aceticum]KJF27928.1 hypothetical protein TZ02_04985 [Clostridium aceticum]